MYFSTYMSICVHLNNVRYHSFRELFLRCAGKHEHLQHERLRATSGKKSTTSATCIALVTREIITLALLPEFITDSEVMTFPAQAAALSGPAVVV
jgi:hypothetical protein